MEIMKILKQAWAFAIIVNHAVAGRVILYYEKTAQSPRQAPTPNFKARTRVHLDHAAYFNKPFKNPQEVTAPVWNVIPRQPQIS